MKPTVARIPVCARVLLRFCSDFGGANGSQPIPIQQFEECASIAVAMTSVSFTELKLGATSPALALSTEVEAEAAAWCTLLKHKRGSERTAYLKQLAHALNTEDRASLQLESRWEVVNTEDIPVRGACAWLCTCCMPGISAHGHAVRQVSYPVPVNAQDADRSWAGRSLSTQTTGRCQSPVSAFPAVQSYRTCRWRSQCAVCVACCVDPCFLLHVASCSCI